MKSFFNRGLAGCAVAALAVLGSVAVVQAQGAEEESPWVKVCNTDPNVNKEICLITQELRTNTGQFLSSVAVREISGEARKTLLIAVPTGMLIQPGLRVQIDGGKQTEAKYGICFPNACYSELVIDDAFVASLKKGGKLILTTLNQQAKPVPLELTLAGFTKVYDGAPMDVAEVQKKQQQLQDELQKRADEARQKLIEKQQQAN
ncbi:invasion associated locus B family protein [Polymorphum gilvum]|uniref:Invasion associated locus B protein n=1 Tax=Polymorphum gilvum (strain LMG 25793 / CGMCC 1.9160 / SL003B-26A1) TaxID=991905 RepID=F2IZT6_POLGS|nr:invasion associated locus B family protein [Polymorphum gilvum]ADZ70662.1 Invasion associated locus B protein [Polymorphum gilvum SL003B-26A1]